MSDPFRVGQPIICVDDQSRIGKAQLLEIDGVQRLFAGRTYTVAAVDVYGDVHLKEINRNFVLPYHANRFRAAEPDNDISIFTKMLTEHEKENV